MSASLDWALRWDVKLRNELGITVDTMRPEGTAKPSEMTDLTWSARKIDCMHPQFKERFWDYVYACDSVAGVHGVDYIVWCSIRSVRKQLELYQQGRTTPGKIVTKTITSRHLFGLAIDWCVRDSKGQPNFNLPKWHNDMLSLASHHGLSSLYLDKGMDPPHVEIPVGDVPQNVSMLMWEMHSTFPGL